MPKRKILSIRIHANYEGDDFEDLSAEILDNGLAIGKSKYFKCWTIFDIDSGLFVLHYHGTKEKALESLQRHLNDSEWMTRLEKGRKALSYQLRVTEMKMHEGYR